MVFKCQSDCFLKKFTSTVVSFTKVQIITLIDGRELACNGSEVILDDTILFPEGGGQPTDHGGMYPTHDKLVHFVDKSLTIGEDDKHGLD